VAEYGVDILITGVSCPKSLVKASLDGVNGCLVLSGSFEMSVNAVVVKLSIFSPDGGSC
jgi:hypothetical protein